VFCVFVMVMSQLQCGETSHSPNAQPHKRASQEERWRDANPGQARHRALSEATARDSFSSVPRRGLEGGAGAVGRPRRARRAAPAGRTSVPGAFPAPPATQLAELARQFFPVGCPHHSGEGRLHLATVNGTASVSSAAPAPTVSAPSRSSTPCGPSAALAVRPGPVIPHSAVRRAGDGCRTARPAGSRRTASFEHLPQQGG
jgi:hypothetical protein